MRMYGRCFYLLDGRVSKLPSKGLYGVWLGILCKLGAIFFHHRFNRWLYSSPHVQGQLSAIGAFWVCLFIVSLVLVFAPELLVAVVPLSAFYIIGAYMSTRRRWERMYKHRYGRPYYPRIDEP